MGELWQQIIRSWQTMFQKTRIYTKQWNHSSTYNKYMYVLKNDTKSGVPRSKQMKISGLSFVDWTHKIILKKKAWRRSAIIIIS